MLRPKLAGPSLTVLLLAASASAAPVQVEGRFRPLTVSGEALVHFNLVPSGKTLRAAVTGPLSVAVKLRRHSRGRARGRTEAIVTVDGKAPERIALPAEPAGSYLAGFGFRPGPESRAPCTARAFRDVAHAEMPPATTASTSHTTTHPSRVG